ncbi:MAG: hypothetical protein H6656_00165 [Ardenticatenaceae bacterium]|nr:hypothetical protein [Ardenticatenaceae bacterium]
MTALELSQLLVLGSGAVIGLIILLKAAYYIFMQFVRLLTYVLRLIFRGAPALIVEVIAGLLTPFIMAVIAALSGVPVDEVLIRFGSWFVAQGSICATYFLELTAQIGAIFIS